jgi:hypothetical protein
MPWEPHGYWSAEHLNLSILTYFISKKLSPQSTQSSQRNLSTRHTGESRNPVAFSTQPKDTGFRIKHGMTVGNRGF